MYKPFFNCCFSKTLQALPEYRTNLELHYSSRNVNVFKQQQHNFIYEKKQYNNENKNKY